MKRVLASIAGMAFATSAFAGTVSSTGTLNLYGFDYGVTTWNIRLDSGSAAPVPAFGAESMTFLDGRLYVAEDHSVGQGEGQLVQYLPGSSGDLASPTRTAMGLGPSGSLWGPEGMTINTSGAGYGAYAPGSSVRITGVETQGVDAFGVFDTGNPGSVPQNTVNALPALDDLSWVGSRNQFAALEDGAGTASFLRFYDHTSTSMTVTSFSVRVIDGAKGLTTVSAAFATSLTGIAVSTPQALIAVSETDGFAVYDTDGNQIGPALAFSAYLPIVELESVAVDEINNLIFLGDEAGGAIHVLQVPAPSAAGVLGLGLLAAARRRRR